MFILFNLISNHTKLEYIVLLNINFFIYSKFAYVLESQLPERNVTRLPKRSNVIKNRTKRFLAVPLGLYAYQLIKAVVSSGITGSLTKNECCSTIYNNYCADGTMGTPYCGLGSCDSVGCNCDGGCRTGWYVTLFEHKNHQGTKISIFRANHRRNTDDLVVCEYFLGGRSGQNVCTNFNKKLSSIDTHDNCVRVWEHKYCEGASITIAPGQGCHSNLQDCEMRNGINWNDKISSISQC